MCVLEKKACDTLKEDNIFMTSLPSYEHEKWEIPMKSDEYHQWLVAQKYQAGTVTAQMHRAGRVEEYHGDLDEHYARDRMGTLIAALTYSTNDKRNNRPNPSNIPFDGETYNNLASYRDAARAFGFES